MPKEFDLCWVNLMKAACPSALRARPENRDVERAVTIERNPTNAYGSPAGYVPIAIVTAGAAQREQTLREGNIHGWAWVEDGLMIQADHDMGCQ